MSKPAAQAPVEAPEEVVEEQGQPGLADLEVVEVSDEGEGVEEAADVVDEQATETTGETNIAEEVAAPTTLLNLRDAKGQLDESRIQEIVSDYEQHQQFARNINDLVVNDVAFKKEYAKALKRKGVPLAPEWDALTVEAPPRPQFTEAQIQAHCNKLDAEGKFAESRAVYDKYVIQPREEALRNELAQEKAKIARENAERQAQQQAVALAEKNKTEWAAAAKAYPTVLAPDPNLAIGFRIKDPAVAAKFAEVNKQFGPNVSLRDVLDLTLARMGRLGKTAPKTITTGQTKIIKKPSLPNVQRTPDSHTKYVPKFEVVQK